MFRLVASGESSIRERSSCSVYPPKICDRTAFSESLGARCLQLFHVVIDEVVCSEHKVDHSVAGPATAGHLITVHADRPQRRTMHRHIVSDLNADDETPGRTNAMTQTSLVLKSDAIDRSVAVVCVCVCVCVCARHVFLFDCACAA